MAQPAVRKDMGVRPQTTVVTERETYPLRSGPGYQAYQILHAAFTLVPLIVGIDKFFHFLTNWDQYMWPVVPRILNVGTHPLMLLTGVIEIAAAIGVAVAPRFFAYIVSAWLFGIVVNLLLLGSFYDIALRDFGLCLGAFALGRLSQYYRPRY